MRLLRILPMLLLLLSPIFANAVTEEDRQAFINRFIDIAVEEMGRTGIPASITLGQAIIESGWGQSSIANEANNFFCIKCFNGWNGPTFKEWDDEKDKSCFRKYDNVIQSFIDHSDFLQQNSRYRPLFELDPLDYKAWAQGLKDCGYATNQQYASKVIGIIESYGLWVYDYAIPASQLNVLSTEEIEPEVEIAVEPTEDFILEGEPFQWNPSPAPTNRVSAPAVMEVPGYRKETIPDATELSNQPNIFSETQEKLPQRRKIRPITPQPNIDLERR